MMPTCLPYLIYKIHRNPHYGGSQNLEHPPSICFSYCYIPCHITSLRYASRNAEIRDTFDCYSKKLFSIVPSKLKKDCKKQFNSLKNIYFLCILLLLSNCLSCFSVSIVVSAQFAAFRFVSLRIGLYLKHKLYYKRKKFHLIWICPPFLHLFLDTFLALVFVIVWQKCNITMW